jgi:hypothetical protein
MESSLNKSFNSNLLNDFLAYYPDIWTKLKPSFIELFWPLTILTLIFILWGAYHFIKHHNIKCLALTVFFILCGIYGAGLLFAMAGYGLSSIGESGRTSIMIGFWFALIFGLITGHANHKGNVASMIICLLILAGFSFTTYLRGQEWATSWQLQQQTIQAWPNDPLTGHPPRDAYVLIAPSSQPIGTFEAPWSVGAFAAHMYRESEDKAINVDHWPTRWMAAGQTGWRTRWTGSELQQSHCSAPDSVLFTHATPTNVWLWDTKKSSIILVREPFDTGCGSDFVIITQ